MTQAAANWDSGSSDQSFLRSLSVLTAIMGVCILAVLPAAVWLQGTDGIRDAIAAWALCLIPAVGALAVSHRYLGTPQALSAVLIGMAFRVVPPLVVCMVLALKGSPSESIHFVSYLLLLYMVALATETMLSVTLVKQRQQPASDK